MFSAADLSIGKGPYSRRNFEDLEGYTRFQHGHTPFFLKSKLVATCELGLKSLTG